MFEYRIFISQEAMDDIDDLYYYIAFEIKSPETAERYREGLILTVNKLKYLAGSFAANSNTHLQSLYGSSVHTVMYKKIAIIYNIIDDTVVVQRIMAGSLIK